MTEAPRWVQNLNGAASRQLRSYVQIELLDELHQRTGFIARVGRTEDAWTISNGRAYNAVRILFDACSMPTAFCGFMVQDERGEMLVRGVLDFVVRLETGEGFVFEPGMLRITVENMNPRLILGLL